MLLIWKLSFPASNASLGGGKVYNKLWKSEEGCCSRIQPEDE